MEYGGRLLGDKDSSRGAGIGGGGDVGGGGGGEDGKTDGWSTLLTLRP